jgi:shikimate dehydrogenase
MVRVLCDAGLNETTAPGGGRASARSLIYGSTPTVTVLGGGGTARAALAAAAHLRAYEVSVVTRRPEAVAALAPVAEVLGLRLTGVPWADAPTAFDADAVISTVPKGVADHLATEVRWQPLTVFFDAIYDPWPTPLAASAAAHGNPVVSGLDLLLAQALGQFEQFTGVTPAPEAAMRAALTAAAAVS